MLRPSDGISTSLTNAHVTQTTERSWCSLPKEMVPVPVLSKSWKATMKRPSGAHNTDSKARNSWNEISLSPTVFLVEMGEKKTTKKNMLNIYFNTVIAEFMPLIQTKPPELSPRIAINGMLRSQRSDLTPQKWCQKGFEEKIKTLHSNCYNCN